MTKTFFLPGVFSTETSYADIIRAYDARLIDFNNPALYPDPANVTIRHLAQFALDDINRIAPDGDIRLFGHSMGGYVIFELLRLMRETDFDTSRIAGLAFLGTAAESDAEEKKTQRLGQVSDVNAGKFEAVVDTMLRAVFGTEFAAKNPDFMARERATLLDPKRGYDRIFVGQQYAIISRPHYRNEGDLGVLPDCPVLFMWGHDDKVVPDAVRTATRQAKPDAYYVVIPDTGHFLTVEAPQSVLKTLEQLFPV